jgi:SAM-dependent methyltransferase
MTSSSQPAHGTSQFWDARFGETGYAYGESPNDFLRESCGQITPGDALSLCEGEGRNAVYLARLGFRVTAVDFSEVGLAKANALALKHDVTISTVLANMDNFDPGTGCWDLVLSIFAQPASRTRQRLYSQLAKCLRTNGAFVLETKADVNATAADRYPGVDILKIEIAPLTVAVARERERKLDEGRYHAGLQRTVQILAFNR